MADGSLIFDTKVDTDGFSRGTKQIEGSAKSQAAKLASIYRKQGMSQSDAFKRAWSEVEHTAKTSTKRIETTIKGSTNKATEYSKKMKNSMESHAASITRAFNGFALMAGLAFIGNRLYQFGKQAVNLASDLEEVQNVVDVSFGAMAYKMEDFAETSIEMFGLSKLAAKEMGSTYMAMSKGMGEAADMASDMAIGATGRAGDIMSFYNKTADEANTLMKSIWTGETEALKSIGVIITDANLSAYALSSGYSKLYKNMNQLEKTQLRYNYVMNATKQAQGDFARTSDSWANQIRVLQERWKELAITLGQVLIPVLLKAIPYVTAFVRLLGDAILSVAKLAGIKPPTDYKKPIKDLGSVSSGLADVETEAEKADKALKNLAGFDELNVLAKKTDDTSGSLSGTDVGVGDVGNIDLDGADFGKDFNDALGDIGYSSDEIYKKMKKAIDKIQAELKKLLPIIKTIATAFAALWAVKKIMDFIAWIKNLYTAFTTLRIVSDLSSAFRNFIDAFHIAKMEGGVGTFKALAQGAKAFRDSLSPLTKILLTMAGSVAAFAITYNIFDDVANGTKTWGEALAITVPLVGGLAVAIGLFVSPLGGVITALAGVVGGIIGYTNAANDMAKADIAEYFSTGDTAISEVAEDFVQLADALVDSEEKYNTNMEQLSDTKEYIGDVSDEIAILIDTVSAAGTATPEQITKIKDAFAELAAASTEYVTQSSDEMKTYLLANREMLEAQGMNVSELAGILDKGSADTVSSIQALYTELDSLAGKTDAVSIQRQSELRDKILEYSGVVDESEKVITELSAKADSYGKINMEDAQAVETAFTDMATAAGEAMKSLETSKTEMLGTISRMELPQAEKNLLLDFVNKNFEYRESEILGVLSPIFQNVHGQAVLASDRAFAKAAQASMAPGNIVVDAWNEKVFGKKAEESLVARAKEFGGFSVSETLNGAKSKLAEAGLEVDVVDKLLGNKESIQQKAGPLGEDLISSYISGAKRELSDSKLDIEDALLKTSTHTSGSGATHGGGGRSFGDGSKSFKAGEDIGKSIVEGDAKGINDNASLATDAMESVSLDVIKKGKEIPDINSPSVVFEEIGKYLMEGLGLGIEMNSQDVITTLESAFDKMMSSLDGFVQRFNQSAQGIMDGITRLQASFSNLSNTPMPRMPQLPQMGRNLPRLATGTVVPANYGEFAAILGDNRRETEVVSPLSTIRQALTEAMAQFGGMGQAGNITIPIYLDGGVIDTVMVSSQQMRMIKSNGRG